MMFRRIITVLTIIILTGTAAFAQTIVEPGAPSLGVTVKRAFVSGADVCIDLVITNLGNYESISFNLWDSKFYDDEGNEYTRNALSKDGPSTLGGKINIPKGVPRKVRIIVHNIDEYASSFLLANIYYEVYAPASYGSRTLVIRDLPISRDGK